MFPPKSREHWWTWWWRAEHLVCKRSQPEGDNSRTSVKECKLLIQKQDKLKKKKFPSEAEGPAALYQLHLTSCYLTNIPQREELQPLRPATFSSHLLNTETCSAGRGHMTQLWSNATHIFCSAQLCVYWELLADLTLNQYVSNILQRYIFNLTGWGCKNISY